MLLEFAELDSQFLRVTGWAQKSTIFRLDTKMYCKIENLKIVFICQVFKGKISDYVAKYLFYIFNCYIGLKFFLCKNKHLFH